MQRRCPALPRDRGSRRALRALAWAGLAASLAALLGCGPRVTPRGPEDEPAGTTARAEKAARRSVPASPPVQEMLVGEMCPRGAAGRPAVMPLFWRSVTWLDASADAIVPVERRTARQFSVLGWDGRRVGIFSVAGVGDAGLDRAVAVGAYAGVSPCDRQSKSDTNSDPVPEPACVAIQASCGLAVAALEPPDELGATAEEPEPVAVGSACVNEDKLLVDIDGDSDAEAFPLAQFVDPVWAPAHEVAAIPRGSATCKPAFAIRQALPAANKNWQGLDVLGVLDIDGDGRREIVLSYHYQERRTWAVYSALGTPGRLDLVGESEPWPMR